MQHVKHSSLLIFTGILWTAACGGSSVDTPEDFLVEFENTLCSAMVNCGRFPDVETCQATNFIDSEQALAQVQAYLDAGTAEYDADAARACLDLFENASLCEVSDLASGALGDFNDTCGQVLVGLVELGGECYADEECAGAAACQEVQCPDACCKGTCVAAEPEPEPAAIGESCEALDGCVSDAYCDVDLATGTGVCTARIPVGQECRNPLACEAGSVCDFDIATLSGTCIVLPGVGETCDAESLIPCNRTDLYCDATDSTCKERPGVGDTCADNCLQYARCVNGTCQALPVQGEACATPDDECMGELECLDGICAQPTPDPVCAY